MAGTLNLKQTYLERQDVQNAEMTYDWQLDTFYLKLGAFGGLHVAHYLDDGVYALFDPETMEVVGFQVENWRKVFLRRHSDLRWPWYSLMLSDAISRLRGTPARPRMEEQIVAAIKRYAPSCASA